MAISAESRLAPLVEADPAWKPSVLYPGLLAAMEMLEEVLAQDAMLGLGHSWPAHAAHRVAAGRRADGQVSSRAILKKGVQCSLDGESRCSTRGTPSPQTASWDSRASESEEGHESGLAQFDSPHEPASRRRIPTAGLFMDTPVAAGSAVAPSAAEATGARATAAARPAPPKQAPQIVTTLMVQNLSRSTTRHDFMRGLDELGFAGRYDFVHVPMALGTRRNEGFAFVNFKMVEDAEEFARSVARIKGSKMRVVPADVQGLDANAWKASSRRRTRIRNSASRPWVVSGHGQDALSHA